MNEAALPSAEAHSAQKARYAALEVVHLRAHQAAVREPDRNDVLSNINDDCIRLALFEGEYCWHCHPDSEECLVVAGKLQIDLAGSDTLELTEWQYVVVPAGTVQRTRDHRPRGQCRV